MSLFLGFDACPILIESDDAESLQEKFTAGSDHIRDKDTMDTRTKYVILVLMSALVVALESVAVEGALNIADIDILLVTTVPVLLGGTILLAASPASTIHFVKHMGRREWFALTMMCILGAAGTFLWFDAVGRIGASKEAILGGGSSEVLMIVILSALFLSERLTRREAMGSALVLGGVFVVLSNVNTLGLSIGPGEIEAIFSSIFFAGSVVITTYLLWSHNLTALSGFQLLYTGSLLSVGALAIGITEIPDLTGFVILLLIGIFPAAGLWMYNAGLPKIGASLTSVLFALSGVMTVGIQLIILGIFPKADMILPQNVPLALTGGLVAFAGVYLLNMRPKHLAGQKKSAEGEI
jgi:drug/metabolite transporter (DMT)-like permease